MTSNGSGPIMKKLLIITVVVIGIGGILYGFVHLKDVITKSPRQVRLYYKKVYRFSEEEKSSFIKTHAGLWEFNLETMAGGRTVKKTDRLEIKENGIVWQVTEWDITMPSGVVAALSQVRTAFIKPYGVMRNDSLCDAFVLSQAFINGTDTCFGGWNFPELWEIHNSGASLVFNKRQYVRNKGEITGFFPHGSVAYVESAENQFFKDTVMGTSINRIYTVRKVDPRTGGIKFVPIRDSLNNLSQLFKTVINRECADQKGGNVDADTVTSLIGRYFDPFIISEELRNFPRELPGKIDASFVVKPDGGIDSIQLTSNGPIDKMLAEEMNKEIRSWRFPSPGALLRTAFTFTMP